MTSSLRSRFAATFLSCSLGLTSLGLAQNFSEVKPSPQQTEWQDLEFGVIIHFGTNTFLDREWGDGTADPKVFNPTQADPEQWMKAAKAAGAKYVVMVTKHHDGFALFPTSETKYSIEYSPYKNGKGDLVKEASDAAKKYGLKFGVYLSPWDRHDPRYQDAAAYDKYYQALLDQLSSNYGEITEFWLDGAGSGGHVYDFNKITEELRTYQPNAMVFADTALFKYGDIRWVGNEAGDIPFQNWNVIDRSGYLRWRPVEVDTPLHKLHWFWHPNDVSTLKSVDELVTTYDQSIGKGGQLMLGIAPDNRGLLPDADVKRLQEFGDAIRNLHKNNLALQHTAVDENVANAFDGSRDTFWSAPAGSHSATLELSFARPVTFDRTETMEWLNEGQNIQQYAIDVQEGGSWKTVAQSFAIGHEKVDHFPAVTASKVRLRIIASTGEARIREFAVYKTDAAK